MNEFDLINLLRPLAQNRGEADNFSNDAAVLSVPDGYELVVTSDTTTAGVHFLEGQSPSLIAQKALRRNISDLNAMGAKPYCYQMCLLLPKMEEAWLKGFIQGLEDDQKHYGLFLSGGDVSSTPGPLSIVITAFGLVKKGEGWRRSGALPGDRLVLSGPVGDAFCGLKALCEGLDEPALIRAYQSPDVRMVTGVVPHAAIDISDGLVQDLGHICAQSGVSARIAIESFSFSNPVQRFLSQGLVTYEDLLTGGDDYQLLLAVPPQISLPEGFQVIGVFETGEAGVCVMHRGQPVAMTKTGWQHFK